MKGSPIQGADIHRHRALELIGLADKTTDEKEVAELLALAAEQLELAEGAPQQQQQAQPELGCLHCEIASIEE